MTIPNQSGHNADPTSQLIIEKQVQAYFEQKTWDPNMDMKTLNNGEFTEISGLDASHIPGINDLLPEFAGVDVKAIVEIPTDIFQTPDGTRGGDHAYFAVAKGRNDGWMFARVGTKQADIDVEGGRDFAQAPLLIGDEPGLRVKVGRLVPEKALGGIVFSGIPDFPQPTRAMPSWAANVQKEFGPSTSKKQIEFRVKESGLEIIGWGKYGTRVLKMPDLQRPA